MRAWLALRGDLRDRREAFTNGLTRVGYKVEQAATADPKDGDVLVIWNRFGFNARCADIFESRGLKVLVAENASWGNGFAGCRWYTIAKRFHNTAGMFTVVDKARWDDLCFDLQPWRTEGETVILPQRGIGPPGVAMPAEWPAQAWVAVGGRIRKHPGMNPAKPLEDDLVNAGLVATWGSGAAIKALLWGIPVRSWMPQWIGEQDNTDAGRLAMFRRLAWAQWRLDEITSGDPFARLLA